MLNVFNLCLSICFVVNLETSPQKGPHGLSVGIHCTCQVQSNNVSGPNFLNWLLHTGVVHVKGPSRRYAGDEVAIEG